jgi:hypothetical protein
MIYAQLARFLLPLMFIQVIQEFSGQFLNGGMARVPQATQTLAAYGLAWALAGFLTSTLTQMHQVGLVLATSHSARRKIQLFVVVGGALLGTLLLLLATTPFGVWVIEDLHGVGANLGGVVRHALFWLALAPILEGLIRLYSGLLLRLRRTEVLSYATAVSIAASIISVFVLLPAPFVQERPILLPVLVTYIGMLVNLGIILWGYRRYVKACMEEGIRDDLGLAYLFHFSWPLALVMAIQGLSRPLINLFVARGPNGTEAVAVLAVVYSLANMGYGWVNDTRSLPPAFANTANSLYAIRRFIGGCGLLSFLAMAILFWTPVRDHILAEWIGLQEGLVVQCRWPLVILTFFPLVVALRSYFHGVALIEHRTRALVPSGPSRIGIIFVALLVFPWIGLYGATLGVAALLCGFVLEAVVVWWGVHSRRPRPQ